LPSYDLVVRNVRVVTEIAVKEADIYVKDGKISSHRLQGSKA